MAKLRVNDILAFSVVYYWAASLYDQCTQIPEMSLMPWVFGLAVAFAVGVTCWKLKTIRLKMPLMSLIGFVGTSLIFSNTSANTPTSFPAANNASIIGLFLCGIFFGIFLIRWIDDNSKEKPVVALRNPAFAMLISSIFALLSKAFEASTMAFILQICPLIILIIVAKSSRKHSFAYSRKAQESNNATHGLMVLSFVLIAFSHAQVSLETALQSQNLYYNYVVIAMSILVLSIPKKLIARYYRHLIIIAILIAGITVFGAAVYDVTEIAWMRSLFLVLLQFDFLLVNLFLLAGMNGLNGQANTTDSKWILPTGSAFLAFLVAHEIAAMVTSHTLIKLVLSALLLIPAFFFAYRSLLVSEKHPVRLPAFSLPSDQSFEKLTPRERETLLLFAQGYSIKRTSEHLRISVNTVKSHLANGYAKLGVHSRDELINKLK